MKTFFAFSSTMLLWWYCYDDALSLWLIVPALGHLPWQVWLLTWLSCEYGEYHKQIGKERRARRETQ